MISVITFLIIYTILNIIDIGQTRTIKTDKKFYEVNPILAKVPVNVASILQVVSNVVILYPAFTVDVKYSLPIMVACVLVKALIVANNVKIGVKFPFKQGG